MLALSHRHEVQERSHAHINASTLPTSRGTAGAAEIHKKLRSTTAVVEIPQNARRQDILADLSGRPKDVSRSDDEGQSSKKTI